jgi:hypothetical protein
LDRATPTRLNILGMVARIVFAATMLALPPPQGAVRPWVLRRPEIFSNLGQGFRRLVRLNS